MSECPGCAAATSNPRTSMYGAACPECEARMLASGPFAHEAYVKGEPANLQSAMLKAWPDAEKYRVGRIAVHRIYTQLHGDEAA